MGVDRLRRCEIGMGRDQVADSVTAECPAMIQACQSVSLDKTIGQTHSTMGAAILPSPDKAVFAAPYGDVELIDICANNRAARNMVGQTDGHPICQAVFRICWDILCRVVHVDAHLATDTVTD